MLPYTIDTAAKKLTAAAMTSAQEIGFKPYFAIANVDNIAEVYGLEINPTGHTLFKVTLTAGVTYDILSASFADPKEMTLYDQFGNVIGVNDEANDPNSVILNNAAYNIDAAYDLVAPYTGVYYIEAGWITGADPNTAYHVLDVLANINPKAPGAAPVGKALPQTISWAEGSVFSYTLPANAFTDADANTTFSYYAVQKDGSELPSWMTLSKTTGTFSGVAPTGTADLDIVVFAQDQTGLASSGTAVHVTTLGAPVDTSPLAVLTTAYTNILRYPPGANTTFQAMVNDVVSGKLSMNGALSVLLYAADTTTSVATLSYQFFTGKIPGQPGYDYLISPTGPNANNLNSAYYQSFNMENRYINFAVNLGKLGEGKDNFAANYGSMSLFDATREAYKTIFGRAPTDEKIHALIDTRVDYFASYGGDGSNGIGTKAAMAGWLLAEAVKADVGIYARSNDAFLFDLADGANFAVSLTGVYGNEQYAYG